MTAALQGTVLVTRPRHPLEGRELRVLGGMRRHGRLELLLVLPDGSKRLIPAEWTSRHADGGAGQGGGGSAGTLGSVAAGKGAGKFATTTGSRSPARRYSQPAASHATAVTANVSASREAVAIARDRVQLANVRFEVADVFSWDPGTRFDVIFLSAWLSHVPVSRFGRFWQLLESWLAGNGRVLFIDEHVDERGKEVYVAGQEEVVERRLADGSTFRVIKNFVDPEKLALRLSRMGWDCVIRRVSSRWVYGEARLVR